MNNTNSITECLNQMVALTKKNLAILKAFNEAFYTKKNHLAVIVNDETYVIPSFISLESRIEALENNMQHIVDAPLTGEAFTYYDGTTQKIELSGYSTTPNHVELKQPTQFNSEVNNIFKDFMTPNPYVRFGIESIPNNIKHVNIKKVALYNESLITAIQNLVGENGGTISYGDAEKILYGYEEGEDYTMYNTIKRLPLRSGIAQGEYEIVEIVDNYQDSNFEEYYELTLDRDLVYYIKNGTIQKNIQVGDNLVTYNDKVMLEVTDINPSNRKIVVKVLYGAYADLQDRTSNNPDLYKIKFYKNNQNLEASKYIDIPLEEDKYVLVFVAPINDTTNTQSPWGVGVFMNVDALTMPDPNDESKVITFREYYDTYVNNVGDALIGIASMMDDDEQVSRLSHIEFETLQELKPVINESLIKVTQINKHLNDTKSIKAIRNLYDQKNQYKSELDVVQRNIDRVTKDLAELSFDDSTNSRTVYETQLSEYNNKKIELVNSINQVIQEISLNANNSETPIENAKYRIRGFINTQLQDFNTPDYVQVIKIDVEYRYKNRSSFTGNAETYDTGSENYIYSDWNKMSSIYRKRIPMESGISYKYEWEELNDSTNNPSFNQIDIPITQGEIVDIRVRFIYNLGYPFAEFTSDWSNIYTQEFPQEFTQNVEVLDIIAENNDEIKTKHFENILEQSGVYSHLNDELQDQSITYMHQAKNITSGFLTEERRVIPLDTKLIDLNTQLEELKAEVYGSASSNLIVTISDSNNMLQLKPNIVNAFHVPSYKTAQENDSVFRLTKEGSGYSPVFALAQLNLNIYNNGAYVMKLHSLFPGAGDQELTQNSSSMFNADDYTGTNKVAMMLDQKDNDNLYMYQRFNQYIYFRTRLQDILGTNQGVLYRIGDITTSVVESDEIENGIPKEQLLGSNLNIVEILNNNDKESLINTMEPLDGDQGDPSARAGFLYPYPGTLNNVVIPAGESFITIKPGESVSIPINFVYWFSNAMSSGDFQAYKITSITRAIAFDLRTSLFQDPISFKLVVDASYDDTLGFKLKRVDQSAINLSLLNSTIAQTTYTLANSGMTPQVINAKTRRDSLRNGKQI